MSESFDDGHALAAGHAQRKSTMHFALNRPPFAYEDTRTWNALRDALHDLERIGAVQLCSGESPIVGVLCAALDRAGVFSLGEGTPGRPGRRGV